MNTLCCYLMLHICIKRQCSCRSANFSPSIIYLTLSIQHQPECAKHKAKKSFETRGSLPIWHKRIEHFLPGNEILAVFLSSAREKIISSNHVILSFHYFLGIVRRLRFCGDAEFRQKRESGEAGHVTSNIIYRMTKSAHTYQSFVLVVHRTVELVAIKV